MSRAQSTKHRGGDHGRRRGRAKRSPAPPDKHLLYELAVTNAPTLAAFFDGLLVPTRRSVRRTLREDFSGSGALARAWCTRSESHHAIALDSDPRVLAKCPATPRLRTLAQDAMLPAPRAQVIAATNFPIGYWHERADLTAYLRRVRAALAPRGLFACDVYGGSDAFSSSRSRVRVRVPLERRAEAKCVAFLYEWRQLGGDRATNLVHNEIAFSSVPGVRGPWRIERAFTYHWRLWSIPELRDAMREAGFSRVEVYDRVGDAIDQDGRVHSVPMGLTDALEDPYVVYVVARR